MGFTVDNTNLGYRPLQVEMEDKKHMNKDLNIFIIRKINAKLCTVLLLIRHKKANKHTQNTRVDKNKI